MALVLAMRVATIRWHSDPPTEREMSVAVLSIHIRETVTRGGQS